MSVVRLVRVDGNRLSVVGLDCLDGTPLLDIKPYFASTDAVAEAVVGWHAAGQKAE
jgi:tRNA (Thr-GGU) A37 N-methylase